MQDKVRGTMMGGAIGDALGYQVEFERGVKPKQVTRFKSGKGVISDDTQMTLFTACALLWRETRYDLRGIAALPPETIYLGYLDWLGTQQRVKEHTSVAWIKNIPELNVVRDPGMTCIEALSSGKCGTLGVPINNSKGCGGVMRIAPIALCTIEDMIGEFAAKTCAITHGHPMAILSAYVLGYIIHYAVLDYSIEKAVEMALDKMNNWVAEDVDENKKLRKIYYKEEKVELSEVLKRAIELAKSDIDDQEAIRELGEGWVAEEAVAIAVFCAMRHEGGFEDAVVAAANHDGDSDSTAAITGNIIGAKLGYEKIPDYYKDNVELKDVILDLADDLANGPDTDAKTGEMAEKWLEKYLYINYA